MGYEVLTAFFLEAGFLGVMLFGMGRVGRGLHFLATCLVAIGTLISAFWILSVNSWMQTPQGYVMSRRTAASCRIDWWRDHLQPVVLRIACRTWCWRPTCQRRLRGRRGRRLAPAARPAATRRRGTMFSMALWMAAIVAPIQMFVGDLHGLNTLQYQPAKIAALEGDLEPERRAPPLILFGWPDMAAGADRLRRRHPASRRADPDP